MKDTAKKVLRTGFGLGILSLTEAKKVAKRVQKELDLKPDESVKLARALVASSRKTSEEVLKTVGKHFETAVVRSGLAKKNELKVVKNVLKRRVKGTAKKAVGKARKTASRAKSKAKRTVKKPTRRKKR